ncbi:MAG TPA: ferritin [Actinobacteria bacterium]|nr:ferritin [Actinomycetota bacterium]
MKFYRCQICGDPFMGDAMPSHCPFCGAHQDYISTAADWVDENQTIGEMTEVSRGNLEKAIHLEVNNQAFYLDASENADTIELQGIFKNLSKIEGEHASAIRKMLKVESPEPDPGREAAGTSDHDNIVKARELEEAASTFYAQSALDASEPRVNKVFKVLSEIESDHIQLETALLDRGI